MGTWENHGNLLVKLQNEEKQVVKGIFWVQNDDDDNDEIDLIVFCDKL